MDSAKAGRLDRNERIELLETCVLPDGLVRCRFGDGWISAQTRSGERLLEPLAVASGETVECGECTLSKEAYELCLKMARTSRLKNKAVLMKIVRPQRNLSAAEFRQSCAQAWTPKDCCG